MVRRILKGLLYFSIALVLFVFVVLPLLASTDKGRAQLAALMSRGLDREVTIGGLDVGFFFSSLELKDLRIANPDGYPDGALLQADSLEMDASLRSMLGGVIRSGMEGSGIVIHIIRKGGGSNLDGLIPKRTPRDADERDAPDIPDLDLSLRLENCRFILEDLDKNERIEVNGVDMESRIENDEGAQAAVFRMRVASLDKDAMRITDMRMDAQAAGDVVEITNLSATLPGNGRLTGGGKVRYRGGNDWTVNLGAEGVGIDGDMLPVIATMYPFLAQAGGQVSGNFDGTFALSGEGLTWEAIKPTLKGTGKVAMSQLGLPSESLLLQIAGLAGAPTDAVVLKTAGAVFDIKNGWLEFARLEASGDTISYDLSGRVSLEGKLDLNMDLMPLVKQFGGGDAYKSARKYVDTLPVRIGGTTARPTLRAPDAKDFAKSALEKQLGGLFDKLGK